MTGRERLNAVLRKQPKDRMPWTTLVDDAPLSLQPEELRGNGGIDFYRHLGCDIFMLNGWGTPHSFTSPRHCWPEYVRTHYAETARVAFCVASVCGRNFCRAGAVLRSGRLGSGEWIMDVLLQKRRERRATEEVVYEDGNN